MYYVSFEFVLGTARNLNIDSLLVLPSECEHLKIVPLGEPSAACMHLCAGVQMRFVCCVCVPVAVPKTTSVLQVNI